MRGQYGGGKGIDWLGRVDAYRCCDPDGLPSLWTPEHVMVRMVDAYEVLSRSPAKIYPQAFGNAWPTILRDFADLTDTQARRNRADEFLWEAPKRPQPIELSRMAEAFAWPMEHLADYPLMTDAVTLYAFSKAMGRDLEPILRRRREGSRDDKVRNEKTLTKWRRRGCEVIAARLDAAQTPVR
jgi:hypothetical protein